MSKQNKENLFLLIKSLSKSEKRQFKLFVGRVKSNKDSKFIKLFNLLDKSTKYDELGTLESQGSSLWSNTSKFKNEPNVTR